MRVAPDPNGEVIFSGGGAGGNGIIPKDKKLFAFLMGILNSSFAEVYVRQNGTQFRGGYLNCEIRFIKDIQIAILRDSYDKQLAKKISVMAQRVVELNRAKSASRLGDRERERIERAIEAHESQIDELVCELYGVDTIPD